MLCTFLAGISYLHLFLLVGGLVLAQLNDHLVALIIDLGFGFLFLWLGRLGRILPHNGMPATRAKQWGRGEVYEKETTSVSTTTVHAGIRGKHAGYQSLSLGGGNLTHPLAAALAWAPASQLTSPLQPRTCPWDRPRPCCEYGLHNEISGDSTGNWVNLLAHEELHLLRRRVDALVCLG